MKGIQIPETRPTTISSRTLAALSRQESPPGGGLLNFNGWKLQMEFTAGGLDFKIEEEQELEPHVEKEIVVCLTARFNYDNDVIEKLQNEAYDKSEMASIEDWYSELEKEAEKLDYGSSEAYEEESDNGCSYAWGTGIEIYRWVKFAPEGDLGQQANKLSTKIDKMISDAAQLKGIFDRESAKISEQRKR